MPYLAITTNASLTAETESALAAAASKILAAGLGKPESYVMVSVKARATLRFAGSNAPAAFLDLKSIGLPGNLNSLVADLTDLVSQHCGVEGNRVFIACVDVSPKHWAHDGSTFA